MAFPESFIQELKMRNPIEDVVGRYVELKRAGRNLVGRCPFHSEKTPSFTVFSDNFHCFGCSAGGDVITFVMRMENLDYKDAIQFLADRCGMTIPQSNYNFPHGNTKKGLSRERAFAMNKLAAKIFHENLKSEQGRKAREYLFARGLDAQTITRFGLGFALDDFSYLLNKLTKEGYTVSEIHECFLCGLSQKNNKPYDLFRNRIMFPIIDTSGNIVAFGGRVMDDSKPKYLNSSDTPVFRKSKNLFALNFAKDLLLGNVQSELVKSGEIILCEGYMDVIAMHKAGFSNAVATLGTAITSEHARIVSRYAKKAYLAYDSDEAGKKAADKAISLLTQVGIDCKIIKIKGAKDPDEYIKKFGSSSFAKLLDSSSGQVDYKLGGILSKYNINNPDEKLKALNEAAEMLSKIELDIERDVYVQRLSNITEISQDSIKNQINTIRKKSRRSFAKSRITEVQSKTLRFNDKINSDAVLSPQGAEIEERILGILILFPEFYSTCNTITPEDFITGFNRRVFEELCKLYEKEITDISQLNEVFSPEEMSRIYEIKYKRQSLTTNGVNALNEQIESLKKVKLKESAKKNKIESDEELISVIDSLRKQKGINQ